MVHESIPGGAELTVAPNGIEAHLIQFIKDSSARVNDTTWFNFDRLLFETGSATLKPESEAQLKSVAQMLQAYPNVKARVGGYTDNSGNAAANLKLSESRAQNVREELEKLGVSHTLELFDGKHGGITYRYPGAIRELLIALDA